MEKEKAKQEEIWSGWAAKVAGELLHTIPGSLQERRLFQLLDSLDLEQEDLVLDAGCFNSEKLWFLNKERGIQGIGVDISSLALERAKEKDPYGNRYYQADLEDLPFRNESFNSVLCCDILEHLGDVARGVSEISRALKKRGILFIHMPIRDNRFSFFWWRQRITPKIARRRYQEVGHDYSKMLTSQELINMLEENSLKVRKKFFYNSFLTHLWDFEIIPFVGNIVHRLMGKKATKSGRLSNEISSTPGLKKIYRTLILPVINLLVWTDTLLSKMGIGNTIFLVCQKRE